MRLATSCLAILFFATRVGAQALVVATPIVEASTTTSLSLYAGISGDPDRDGVVRVTYQVSGAPASYDAPDLFRVYPETIVVGSRPAEHVAGSVFGLLPDTLYQITLTASDPDVSGATSTRRVSARTRPVPTAPSALRTVRVTTPAELRAAFVDAMAGDDIVLAPGVYVGTGFSLFASGSLDHPIVIRSETQNADDVWIDGSNCTSCVALEVYGSYTYVEDIGLRNARRGFRFQNMGPRGGVARRLHVMDVDRGIGVQSDHSEVTICDNVVEGRTPWPPSGAPTSSLSGIEVNAIGASAANGMGTVVCHNRVERFEIGIAVYGPSRAVDVFGNDISEISTVGLELPNAERNVRVYDNRIVSARWGVGLQPTHGGPVYVMRNVFLNVTDDQIRLRALDFGGGVTDDPSGALVFHNTFVSSTTPLLLGPRPTQRRFKMFNNLFVGIHASAADTVFWDAETMDAYIDGNGYHPDGRMYFGTQAGTTLDYASFAAAQGAGVFEANGVLLRPPVFRSITTPISAATPVTRSEASLHLTSNARDRGRFFTGYTARMTGAAPDLGAVELGCPEPAYGPRPPGVDERTPRLPCVEPPPMPDAGVADGGTPDTGTADAGASDAMVDRDSDAGRDGGLFDAPNDTVSGATDARDAMLDGGPTNDALDTPVFDAPQEASDADLVDTFIADTSTSDATADSTPADTGRLVAPSRGATFSGGGGCAVHAVRARTHSALVFVAFVIAMASARSARRRRLSS